MKKELVCINCPMGCRMTVCDDGGEIAVEGNTCIRGKSYAVDELRDPKRTVTALVRVNGRAEPLPVKTKSPVSKKLIGEIAELLRTTAVDAPVRIGDTVVPDICGTGVAVVATDNT